MSSTPVAIENSLPLGFTPLPLTTAGKYVSQRRMAEFLPDAQVEYKYSANNRITFTINDGSSFLDGLNAYLKFDLTVTATDTNGPVDAQLAQRHLAEGGAHALIRSLHWSAGAKIEEIESYNKLYAVMSNALHSPTHVEFVEAAAGDSMDGSDALDMGDQFNGNVSYTAADANYDHTGGAAEQLLILGAAGAAASELRVGDLLRIETAVLNHTARVLTIIDNGNLTVEGLPAADIAAAAILSIKLLGKKRMPSARRRAANTAKVSVTLKPWSGFLQQLRYIPLPYLKNLKLVLELERPELALVSGVAPSGANSMTMDYTVENVRFLAPLVQPDETLRREYDQMFNSDMGVLMNFPSYRHYLAVDPGTGAGRLSYNINANIRNARHAITVIQNALSESVSQSSYNYDSVATFIKAKLREFSYKIGSERYPHYEEVKLYTANNTDDPIMAMAFQNLQYALGSMNATHKDVRFRPQDWQSVNTVFGQANDSKKLILACRFDRDGQFSGVDTTNNNFQIEVDFEAAYGGAVTTRYLHTWINFDTVLKISKNGTVVFY